MSTPAMTAAPSTPAAPSSTPSTSSAPASAPATPSNSAPSSTSAQAAAQSTGSGGGDPGAKSAGTTDQSPPSAAAVAEAVRKHKLKVNGKEMELEEPEVLRRAQLAEAAEQKFQEAAKARREAAQVLEMLKQNPLAVLTKLGINTREFSEKYLAGELQKEMLTPEQRELMELRDFRSQQEKAQQEAQRVAQEQAQQREFAALQERAAKEYDTKITEVLTQTNLPKTPETVKRVAGLLKNALEKGYELDVPTAVDMVKQGYMGDVQSLLAGLKGEHLVKMLGDSLLKEIRQYDLARIKAKLNPQQDPAAPAAAPVARERSEPSKYMNQDQWIEQLRKKAGVE